MAEKFLKVGTNGLPTEQEFTTQSTGATDAGKPIALDGSGKLDPSVLPNGIGSDANTITAGEALAAGDFVYINGSGQVMKADGTASGKAAVGYVLGAVASGQPATVYFDDSNTALTGLTPGARYFLSATQPGRATTTIPTAAGHIVQELGIATSASSMHVGIQTPIVRS